MTNKEKLEQLYEVHNAISSNPFQECIMKPLFEELDSLKSAYDCKTLSELSTLKGKKQGLTTLIDILKQVERDITNTKHEVEQEELEGSDQG